jgi:hypothetical protein
MLRQRSTIAFSARAAHFIHHLALALATISLVLLTVQATDSLVLLNVRLSATIIVWVVVSLILHLLLLHNDCFIFNFLHSLVIVRVDSLVTIFIIILLILIPKIQSVTFGIIITIVLLVRFDSTLVFESILLVCIDI